MASKRNDVSARIFQYGDIDTRGAEGEDRLAILNAEERAALFQAKNNGEGSIRSAYTRLQETALRYKRLRDRREAINRTNVPRIAFAKAWRELGAQERYPHAHLHWGAQAAIFFLLAGLDFYVFAQAYAVVDDIEDFSVQWWLGGLLGLVVFIAGVILAHQLKTVIVSRSQRMLVDEIRQENSGYKPIYRVNDTERTLPYSRASGLAIMLSGSIFGALVALAIWLRFEAASGDLPAVMMTGIIPLVIVAVEIYLHDPLHRLEKSPQFRERRAERKTRKRRIELDNIIASYTGFIQKTQAGYAHQRQIAKVTAADLGMNIEHGNSKTLEQIQAKSDDWSIDFDDLLKTRVSSADFLDDLPTKPAAGPEKHL